MKLAFIGENDFNLLESDARFAVNHGLAALEYNYWGGLGDLTPETAAKRRAVLDKYGIGVSALGLWGLNYMNPDAKAREEAQAILRRGLEIAKILRADHLILGAGEIPNAPVEQLVAEFVKVFPPLLEPIRAAGISPVFYPLHGGSFLTSTEICQRVWEKMPDLKLKVDPANWHHHGDDYLDLLRRHGNKVGYLHVKEHLYLNKELVTQPAAGMGDIAWGKVFAFLYEHGFNGYLSFEPHGPIWGKGDMRDKMLLLSKKYISQYLL